MPDLGVFHQHAFSWNPDITQTQKAIVNCIETKFGSNITHRNTYKMHNNQVLLFIFHNTTNHFTVKLLYTYHSY